MGQAPLKKKIQVFPNSSVALEKKHTRQENSTSSWKKDLLYSRNTEALVLEWEISLFSEWENLPVSQAALVACLLHAALDPLL